MRREQGIPTPEERMARHFGPEAAKTRQQALAEELARERRERGQMAPSNEKPATAPAAEARTTETPQAVQSPKTDTWVEPVSEEPRGEWKKAA